jgi:NAD dependent epimerase/dehydratase family enzyme
VHRPAWIPVPAFVLRLRFGEGADVMLTGQRILPARAQAEGFRFAHPELAAALRSELNR